MYIATSNGSPEVWHWTLSAIYYDIRSINDMMSNCIFIGLLRKQIWLLMNWPNLLSSQVFILFIIVTPSLRPDVFLLV
jgi:hypothetical protein